MLRDTRREELQRLALNVVRDQTLGHTFIHLTEVGDHTKRL